MFNVVRSACAAALFFGVAAGTAAAQPASPAVAKAAWPAACDAGTFKPADCRDALTAMLEAAPDKHVLRLRRADAHHHLGDADGAAQDLARVQASLPREAFLAALAEGDDFIEAGAPDCRFVIHKDRREAVWSGPCANGAANGAGVLGLLGFRWAGARTVEARNGILSNFGGVEYAIYESANQDRRYRRAVKGDRPRNTTEAAVPDAIRPVLRAITERFAGQRESFSRTGDIKASDQKFGNGEPYHCYSLYTRPGSHWRLTLETPGRTPWIGVRAGEYCDRDSWAKTPFAPGVDAVRGRPNSGVLEYAFNASGGVYWVAIAGSAAGGAYTLKFDELPGQAAKAALPAGPPVPYRGWSGSASTVWTPRKDGYQAGQTIQDCPVCPQMVVAPAGAFMMGSPATEEGREGNEGPRHMVTIGRPFAIGKFEVTFDEWNACVADGGCVRQPADQGWGQGRRPVINIGPNDMKRYVGWLTHKTDQLYFLPSEAEWEYAARGGADTPWNTGDGIITDDANFLNQYGRTVPVGGFAPNAFGLYDVHGNVAEFTQDCIDVGYFEVPTNGDAKVTPAGCRNVVRGGSYRDEPVQVRSAARGSIGYEHNSWTGFRVVRALD